MEMEIGIDHFHESDHEPDWSDVWGIEDERAIIFAVDVVSRMHEEDGTLRSSERAKLLRSLLNTQVWIGPQTEEERNAACYAVEKVLLMYEGQSRGANRRSALRRVRDQLRIVKHIVSHPNPAERTWCGRAVDAVEPQAQVRSTDMKGHIVCDACRGTLEHVMAALEAGMYPERAPGVDR